MLHSHFEFSIGWTKALSSTMREHFGHRAVDTFGACISPRRVCLN